MSSRCLTRDELERLHAGELPRERAAAVEGHLRECAACGRVDAELREEHEAMLAELGGLLPTAPHSPQNNYETATVGSSAGEATSLIGQRVGSYTIQGVIGEGGMGAVYRAQQDKPRQLVALKVIRGGLPSPREMRRFEFESEVLGHLQHIGIARIYQAGLFETPFGQQPYFAMELIDGQALNAFAEKAGLGTRQRLELIARVADAVQHAHSNGIMHLDLKPGNVLVTADRQPKVVDFGLARLAPGPQPPALAGVRLTTILGGTPAYMSPEQVSGDPRGVDARSDVYSLGVVAYELLTGRLPYSSLNSSDRRIGPNDVFRIVREEEPTRLTRATGWDGSSARTFAGDVEAIVHKALEKDKERRYQTAAALAADIRRYLTDQPIAARPASAMYQFRKFARRNRVLVGGVVATIVVLVAGLVGTGLALQRALAAEAEQIKQRQRADEQRQNARLVADEMGAMLEGVKASVALGRDTTMLREMLDKVAERIEEGKLKDSPEAELRLRWTIGVAYTDIGADGSAQRAEAILMPTLKLAERAFGAESAEEATSLHNVAYCLQSLGRSAEALSQCEASLEMRQRLFMGDHPGVADSLNGVASCLVSLGRPAEALPRFEAALEMDKRLFKGDHREVARSVGNVAYCLESLGRPAEALPRFEAGLEMTQRQFKGDHPDVARNLSNVAHCLESLGQPAEALPQCEAALEMRRRLFMGDHSDVAHSLNTVAACLDSLGRSVEALPRYQAALEMRQRLFKGDHPDVAASLNNVASCLNSLGRSAEALPRCEAALEMHLRLFKGDHPKVAQSLNSVAYCLNSLGRPAEALPKYEAALEMRQRLLKGDHPGVAGSMNNVASCLESLGRSAEALPKHEAALEMWQRLFKGDHPEVSTSLNNVACCLQNLGRSAEALPKFEAALEMDQRLFKGDHPDVAGRLNNVAYCLKSVGRPAESLPKYEEALEMRQRLFKGDHPDVAQSLNNVASCLRSLDRPAEALPKYEAGLEMLQRLFKGDHPDVARSLNNVASCLQSLGRSPEALPKFEAALEMHQRVLQGGHPNVLHPQIGVARTLVALGRFAEAEPLLTDAAGQCERSAATRRVHWQAVLKALVILYDAWRAAEPDKGYDAKAAEWRAKLEAWQASTQPSSSE